MSELEGIATREGIREAISELEELADEAPPVAVAAIHVLKNELAPMGGGERRQILFERRFLLPGGRADEARGSGDRQRGAGRTLPRRLADRLRGREAVYFRDRCDRYFWQRMVPVIEARFGILAHPFMNTINEAIINYAEYSFRSWAVYRRVSAHIFRTEGDLAYGIVRPLGIGLRSFDPLALRQKEAGTLREMRRGWGHTLLMKRALFISFDQAPWRRGMMVAVGPEEPPEPA